jgi:hypothetical protein
VPKLLFALLLPVLLRALLLLLPGVWCRELLPPPPPPLPTRRAVDAPLHATVEKR